jgi:hypothetical protein
MTGWKVVNDNFRLRFEGNGVSHAAVVKAIEALAVPSFWEDADLWQRIVTQIPPYRFSKFQAALPPRFELELERSVLQRSNIAVANIFDTLAASRRIRGKQAGGHSLAAVCRRELDKVLDKNQQISDWTRRPLTGAQVNYAALDAMPLT